MATRKKITIDRIVTWTAFVILLAVMATSAFGAEVRLKNGFAVINADNTITYRPDPGFIGTEIFSYVISDGRGGTDEGTIAVEVSCPKKGQKPKQCRGGGRDKGEKLHGWHYYRH